VLAGFNGIKKTAAGYGFKNANQAVHQQHSMFSPGSFSGKEPGDILLKADYISSTVTAPGSQTSTQLSQPKHSSALTGTETSSSISNTSTGQTSTHSSQPSHFSGSTVTTKLIGRASFRKKELSQIGKIDGFAKYRAKPIYQLIQVVKLSYIFFK
jgi:hypothetical protein